MCCCCNCCCRCHSASRSWLNQVDKLHDWQRVVCRKHGVLTITRLCIIHDGALPMLCCLVGVIGIAASTSGAGM